MFMSQICTNCGSSPCYHICPNSDHYYSPEQERYDDQFYGDDDISERYAGELVGLELDEPEEAAPPFQAVAPIAVDPDDIAF